MTLLEAQKIVALAAAYLPKGVKLCRDDGQCVLREAYSDGYVVTYKTPGGAFHELHFPVAWNEDQLVSRLAQLREELVEYMSRGDEIA